MCKIPDLKESELKDEIKRIIYDNIEDGGIGTEEATKKICDKMIEESNNVRNKIRTCLSNLSSQFNDYTIQDWRYDIELIFDNLINQFK